MMLFVTLLVFVLETVHSLDVSLKHVIGSQPLHFVDGPETEHHVLNSTIILKKKGYTIGPVFYNSKKKPEEVVNNHYISPWKRPFTPLEIINNNHKGSNWKQKWSSTTTTLPYDDVQLQVEVINNHKSGKKPSPSTITDVLGDRVKHPDIIRSSAVRVLDAPSHLKTTIKHNKIIVIQKRNDENLVQQQIQANDIKGNFSVAPVMDPWSNIPIPSWTPNKDRPIKSGSPGFPSKGGLSINGGSSINGGGSPQTVLPNLPFMPFFNSLFSKPLSPAALNTGMQGIKAMQGFLRNSLLGAMFCFLPSAFIALTLTATQRSELRSSPEMDDLVIFCKKCLENLREAKSVAEYMENNRLDDENKLQK